MARQVRLAQAGQAHLVSLYGHSQQPVFLDDDDRTQFLAALRESALAHRVAVHAYVLATDHVHLLLTPDSATALGALMQGLGRRYGARFNRRHNRAGSLWLGRYRSTVLQPGETVLEAMLFVDLHAARAMPMDELVPERWSSGPHHLGQCRDPVVADGPDWWALGNTPFEREAAYRACWLEGLSTERALALAGAARQGWALGDESFLARLGDELLRPVRPRPRGRPPKPRA
jgi:putative transposase